MIKSVDKAFKSSVFIFKYQEGYETAEFHKIRRKRRKKCLQKIIPQTFMISNNGKTANFLTNLLMAFF